MHRSTIHILVSQNTVLLLVDTVEKHYFHYIHKIQEKTCMCFLRKLKSVLPSWDAYITCIAFSVFHRIPNVSVQSQTQTDTLENGSNTKHVYDID